MRLALAGLVASVLLIAPLFWLAPTPLLSWSEPAPGRPAAPLRAVEPRAVARALGLSEARTLPPLRPSAPPPIRLLGTLVAAAAPWSLALTEDSARHARTLGPGSLVDGWVVVGITRGRLELEDPAGQHTTIETGGVAGALTARPSAPSTLVLKRSDLEREVKASMPDVISSTRVMPVLREGSLAGFTLYFREGSPLTRLGLRSGDVIRTLDGRPITPQLALEFSTRWQTAAGVEAGLERDGQPLTLRLQLE